MSKALSSKFIDTLKENVKDSYFLYKVCEGCDKLVIAEHAVCPNCLSYRFNTSRKVVVKALTELIEVEADFFTKSFEFL